MKKAYKVFDKDWKCRDFQFEIGKTYKHEGKIKMCRAGFHFCLKLADCFNYYSFNSENKVAEISYKKKNTIHGNDKSVTSEIKIVKELSWFEVLELINIGKNNTGIGNSGNWNSGNWNSGNWNSGDGNSNNRNSGNGNSGIGNSGNWNSGNGNSGNWNSGDWNSGNCNSGDWNSGYRNSGDWNSCNYESGYFNSETSNKIRIFNKDCKREDWRNAIKPNFLYFYLTEYKNDKLITYNYKEAFQNSFEETTKEDVELLLKLPNFNYKIFEEISGISKEMIKEKLKEQ